MRDMHVHTEFSCDSDAKMEDYIEKGACAVYAGKRIVGDI